MSQVLNSAICINHFWVRPVLTPSVSQSVPQGRHFKHLIKAKRTSQLITYSIDGEFRGARLICLLWILDFQNCVNALLFVAQRNCKRHFLAFILISQHSPPFCSNKTPWVYSKSASFEQIRLFFQMSGQEGGYQLKTGRADS